LYPDIRSAKARHAGATISLGEQFDAHRELISTCDAFGMTSYAGQTVLVTGASRGIGLAVAWRFAGLGAAVGMVARDPERIVTAARRVPGRAHPVAADLTDPTQCADAVDQVQDALGPIDVLVCCAGVLQRDFVEDIAVEDFERHYRLHTGAPLWLSQRVLPAMRRRDRGRIVLVSSELGLIGAPTYGAYCASKWALVGLAESLQHELAGTGVRATVVCPGDVRTEQLRDEHTWGPTGGSAYEQAMEPDRAAHAIVRAASGKRAMVIVDDPRHALFFRLMAGPRRSRFGPVHAAFEPLLRERRPRAVSPADEDDATAGHRTAAGS
jgi:NAD(P)-dependent dehydrogenase (short-subunit alcohol dehydrogenase family)